MITEIHPDLRNGLTRAVRSIAVFAVIAAPVKVPHLQERQSLERVIAAAVSVQLAEAQFAAAYADALGAYARLKTTDGTAFLQSLEGLADRSLEEAGSEFLERLAVEAGSTSGQKAFVRMIGAAANAYDIGRLGAIDATLITRNVRYHWQAFTRLRPASARIERGRANLVAALSSAGSPSAAGITILRMGSGTASGSCSPKWSGPAVVELILAVDAKRVRAQTECRNGAWAITTQASVTASETYAYATLSDGRTVLGWSSVALR